MNAHPKFGGTMAKKKEIEEVKATLEDRVKRLEEEMVALKGLVSDSLVKVATSVKRPGSLI